MKNIRQFNQKKMKKLTKHIKTYLAELKQCEGKLLLR